MASGEAFGKDALSFLRDAVESAMSSPAAAALAASEDFMEPAPS